MFSGWRYGEIFISHVPLELPKPKDVCYDVISGNCDKRAMWKYEIYTLI